MSKRLILFFAALAACVSCGKEEPVSVEEAAPSASVSFDLTAIHPDATRAVKKDWEAGDAIFVFFTGAAAPRHLKMTYDGSAWSSVEYDGATPSPGALGLKNGDTGTMRAVFLPFGSDATIYTRSPDDTRFRFNRLCSAYYLTATLEYTVRDNQVNGAFSMEIPDGYVQFFVEDAEAVDGGYRLATDAVIPVYVESVSAEGDIEEVASNAGDKMWGYVYGGGYLFSGRLNKDYGFEDRYYFAKTKYGGGRADYFVTGKTLSSHSAVKLPGNANVYNTDNTDPGYNPKGKWVPVGGGIYVDLIPAKEDCPTTRWATCNIHQDKPEDVGRTYTFADLKDMGGKVPTKELFEILSSYTYYPMTIQGKRGFVIAADRGFLFLPWTSDGSPYCLYWTQSTFEDIADTGWYFEYAAGPLVVYTPGNKKTDSYAVRLFQ